jgi:hypothetical protein
MRIKRTKSEITLFRQIVSDYMSDDYPRWAAEERAWDHLLLERQIRGYKPRRTKVAA